MPRLEPLPRRAEVFVAVFAAAALAWVVHGAWPRWRTERIGVAIVRDEQIELGVATCLGRDQDVEVLEDDRQVTITVELNDDALGGDDCDGNP